MMFAYPGRGKGGGQRLIYLFWGEPLQPPNFSYLFQPCLSLKKTKVPSEY